MNRLYGSTSTSQLMQLTTLSTASTSAANSTTYETYAADIVSRKFAVGGSYAIYVFFGDAPADAAAWSTAANLVGMHGVFTGKTSHALEDVNVRGSVPLTTALLEKLQSGELKSMDIETVQSYLRQNLHWRAGRVSRGNFASSRRSDIVWLTLSSSSMARRSITPICQTSPSALSRPKSNPRKPLTNFQSWAMLYRSIRTS